ncbi:hypothetical protein EDB82DRAFT_471501 [Fusarium venenatum]|uniref:uncharacterized protein n=1 Tax=Fusarium venenatum TaxID=56646 RepID=UPI001D6AA16C|nr:hypothetical protein EDB82DRAFT_471501 [Fusarium venenatum]
MALSTIAEGWEWPDDSMAIDHPALELPVPAEEPPVPYVPWEELRRQEDRKLERMEESGNEASYSHLYAHLENSELDWSLEGRLVCRVPRCPSFGKEFPQLDELKQHLNTKAHKALDEWYGSVAVFSPGPRFPRVPPLDNDAGADQTIEEMPVLSMGLTVPSIPGPRSPTPELFGAGVITPPNPPLYA